MDPADYSRLITQAARDATVKGWNSRFLGHLEAAGLKLAAQGDADEYHINVPAPMEGQSPSWDRNAYIVEAGRPVAKKISARRKATAKAD